MSYTKDPSPATVWVDTFTNVLLQLMAEFGKDADMNTLVSIALAVADNAVESYTKRFKAKAKA